MARLKEVIDNAICLALSMLAGAFVGAWLFNPLITSGPEDGWPEFITGVFLGAIAGAIAWKFYAAHNPLEPPPQST